MIIIIWLIIGIMIVAGLAFTANRPLKTNVPTHMEAELLRKATRWISLSVLIIGFCLLIGIVVSF